MVSQGSLFDQIQLSIVEIHQIKTYQVTHPNIRRASLLSNLFRILRGFQAICHCFCGYNKRRAVSTQERYPLARKHHPQCRKRAYIQQIPLPSDPIQVTITLFRALVVFLNSQESVWIKISRSFRICWCFGRFYTIKAATFPRRAGACQAILRCWRCGYTSFSDLIHVVVALYTIKVFSYALRDLSVSKFHVFSKPIDGLVAATRREPLHRRKETHHVKRLCRQWALSKRFTGGNRTSSNHEQVVRGKLFLFEVFFMA